MQLLGDAVLFHCFGKPACFLQRPAQTDVQACPLFRGKRDGALPARDGRPVLLALHPKIRQLLPKPSIFWIKIYRVFEPRLGLGELTKSAQGHADLQVTVGQIGIETERFQIAPAPLRTGLTAATRCRGCDDECLDLAGAGPPPGCE